MMLHFFCYSIVLSALIATPIEVLKGHLSSILFRVVTDGPPLQVKLQLQSQKAVSSREFKGPIDCARQIIRVQGIGGLWSGFTGSLAFRSNFFWMFLSFEVCEPD
jgi:solute carrier family 25 carnitine/acylcarnitine transporter 20/29